jgi:membrane protein DedA with SNARE-associated domain/rhodanese-related sulfurtransferase
MNYYLVHTTYPILFLSVFARQLSLPVPAILFLLSGGALAGSGRLSFPGILAVSVLGCLLGDLAWFEAGRLRGKRVLRLLCALAPDPSYCIRQSRTTFARKGLPVLLIAKFVPGLDGVTPPLAGMTGASRARFLLFDSGGAALWSGAYIGIGFLFAAQLDKAARYISVVADTLILVLGVPVVIVFIWKLVQLLRMFRQLRPLHIAPEELKERLDAGEKIGVLDLLRFEDDPEDIEAIPGAMRIDPRELRRRKHIVMPDGVDVVLYCGSKNSFVSARVAMAMRKKGIERIHVLAGGRAAWKALGFPLSTELADTQTELARLGIVLHPPLQARNVESSSELV